MRNVYNVMDVISVIKYLYPETYSVLVWCSVVML